MESRVDKNRKSYKWTCNGPIATDDNYNPSIKMDLLPIVITLLVIAGILLVATGYIHF